MNLAEKVEQKFIAPIDQVELTVRMIEAATGIERPPGATPAQALACMGPEDIEAWTQASTAALLYIRECIGRAQQSN